MYSYMYIYVCVIHIYVCIHNMYVCIHPYIRIYMYIWCGDLTKQKGDCFAKVDASNLSDILVVISSSVVMQ